MQKPNPKANLNHHPANPPSRYNEPDANGIISLDPSSPLQPQPLIRDILRTRHCVPGSVFLVESVERSIPVPDPDPDTDSDPDPSSTPPPPPPDGRRRRRPRSRGGRSRLMRTVRLILGDGEYCIQAFLKGEAHWLVDSGVVQEGCYVRVDRFEEYKGILRREREVEREKERQLEMGKVVGQGSEEKGGVGPIRDDGVEDESGNREEYEDDEIIEQLIADEEGGENMAEVTEQTAGPHPSKHAKDTPSNPPPPRQNDPDELEYISDSDLAFETLTISAERVSQRRIAPTAPDARKEPQAANLTPLASIPHLRYRQNWMINVLAVLTSLDGVEPSYIGPSYRQRTARITDASVPDRQIHLTVYLDPEEFAPEVGGVVLLLGVKNHLFEGGSLRKYVSDGLARGERWWVGRPEAWGGVRRRWAG
ncbi:hypothetical protein NEMBOFW57_010019 [Staphylotrichum longicolle]|uniref:Uncharacterized protein n=1 Tax=Staphylotrichum longicolle TaxID=669026 RepID=A0AAD4HV74_9PEZI|nr:hypothetical protein NEMBOFW57_010019 [Staphylotrichum longicolle]